MDTYWGICISCASNLLLDWLTVWLRLVVKKKKKNYQLLNNQGMNFILLILNNTVTLMLMALSVR